MCPRPIIAAKVILDAELENLVTPKTVDGERKKSANFFIGDDQEDSSIDDDEDYGYSESEDEYDNSCSVARLNVLSCVVTNTPLYGVKDWYQPDTRFIVELKRPPIGGHEQLDKQTVPSNRQLISALKVSNTHKHTCKKSVRFADSMGIDLVQVKFFSNDMQYFDECLNLDYLLPSSTTRKSAFTAWKATTSLKTEEKQLLFHFPLRTKEEVSEIVEAQNVCIVSIDCKGMIISGSIQVKNISYNKQVRIRYTLNDWDTYAEIPCTYSFSNTANNRDSFTFSLCLPTDLPVGSKCQMCANYTTADQTFWDNNNGRNYKLDCCMSPSTSCYESNRRRNVES